MSRPCKTCGFHQGNHHTCLKFNSNPREDWRKRAVEAEARVAELEAELRKAEIERDRFRALILTALKENGCPIDSSDTIDFVDYVVVRRVDFEALETAIK